MRIHVAGASDIGQVRATNDDHYCIGPFVEQSPLTSLSFDADSALYRQYGLLAAVADGMGGYTGGGFASRVTLETLSALFYSERHDGASPEEFCACLQRYLEQTQHAVSGALQRTSEYREAGTTLAGIALLPPDISIVFHVGDSRVLRAAAGYVQPLTVDHTPVGEDVASGRLTEDEAAAIPTAQQLTRSLGIQGDAEIAWKVIHSATAGHHFLLGTDGWHGLGRGLSRQEIQTLVRHGGTAEMLARTMIQQAIASGSDDNATVVVVHCTEDDTPHG